jgi:hypothetical protein
MQNSMRLAMKPMLIGSALLGQNQGAIRGTVSDPSAAVVSAATVTARNVETGTAQTATTNEEGAYSFPYLQIGNYQVTVEKPGFRKSETNGVRVDVASVTDVNVKMLVGGVDQSIDVTAASPLLETTGSNLGKVVATRAITDLPLFISGGSVRRRGPSCGSLLNQSPFYYNPTAGRVPYFGDWNLTIDRTLTKNSVFRATYHATIGNKLLSRQQNQNQLDPKYWAIYGTLLGQPVSSVLNNPIVIASGFKLPYPNFPTNLQLQQALRPFPQYSGIGSDAGGQNDGHMTFHVLESSFEHRFDHGLYLLFSYTFAKLISGSNGEDANRTSDGQVQNQYNRRLDKAVASQDTPHNLRMSYVYELPFGRGKQFLGHGNSVLTAFVGNWKLSAIHTYVSGTPLMINCNQNFFGAGANARCSSAPGATTGQIPLLNPAWTRASAFTVPYLNNAAFVLPANMTYGDTGRRLSFLRTPWTVQEDVALIKEVPVREKVRLEVRASASNALNRVTFGSPNTTQSSSQFGLFTGQGNNPRNIQMGARLFF